MKKIVLPILAGLFAISTISAAEPGDNYPPKKAEIITPKTNFYSYKVSSFCKLIQMGDYAAVKALIEAGEDVNKKSNGLTPLMFAARHNKADIANLLIKNGAKLKVKSDKLKITALEFAKRSKAKDAMRVIENALNS